MSELPAIEEMYTDDPQFGRTVDYDYVRRNMRSIYDTIYPEFNLLACMEAVRDVTRNEPSVSIAAGASFLAYTLMVAAGEHEMSANLKDYIFTLGWTEEHSGSDLLSIRTQATPASGDPDEKEFHIQGEKWLINNSFHADYHIVLAKVDPNQDGPRSLSFFLVPRSSTSGWERLPTHVMDNMVLTKFKIDGPGTLIGKVGHGLSIIQRMALGSRYQASYKGLRIMMDAINATITHLSTKRIFGDNPINYGNVYRQLYNLVIKAALLEFIWHRALTFGPGGSQQFYGTMLKSYFLLACNAVMAQNLLVAGSKGFLKESIIGRNAIDSFVLPVFDGHYTINTLMSVKYLNRYVNANARADLDARLQLLRDDLFVARPRGELDAKPRDLRKPPFFDYADYIERFALPFDLKPRDLLARVRDVMAAIDERALGSDPEYRYKLGTLLHALDALPAACELWKLTGEDEYLNAVVMQYNEIVENLNGTIAEGGFAVDFLLPVHYQPLDTTPDDPAGTLRRLMDIRAIVERLRAAALVG